MILQKTYMLKHFDRMGKHVMVGNRRVLCEFTSVSSNNRNIKGTFTTTNLDVMQKLEESPDFNREYYLYKEEKLESPVKENLEFRSNPLEVKKLREEEEKMQLLAEDERAKRMSGIPEETQPEPKDPAKGEPKDDNQANDQSGPDNKNAELIVSMEEVGNVQQAKEYLKKKFPELTARQISNKASVMDIAKEKGIKFEAIQA